MASAPAENTATITIRLHDGTVAYEYSVLRISTFGRKLPVTDLLLDPFVDPEKFCGR